MKRKREKFHEPQCAFAPIYSTVGDFDSCLAPNGVNKSMTTASIWCWRGELRSRACRNFTIFVRCLCKLEIIK